MKVAIVHDYIKEYGGAERVLSAMSEMFPKAPIYTAFRVKDSTADKHFKGKKIIESWLSPVLRIGNLYSPLRFLAPVIWKSFDLSGFDLVIASSSWYVTRGFKVGPNTTVVCYCHTPPRWLYGYETSVGFTKYWPVKIYAALVGHFMRMFDFDSAQKVDYFIANSINVRERIQKFYRRKSTVIYPPVETELIKKFTANTKKEDFYLIVSRLVGAKGLEETALIAKKLDLNLKIVGESHGFSEVENNLKKISGGKVELLGRVEDEKLYKLLGNAKGFIALARDEDFGMTVVEAQAAGTPVIAYNGGGFRESVINGETGILIQEISESALSAAIKKLETKRWDRNKLIKNAEKFSKKRFEKEMLQFLDRNAQKKIKK
jgi:glycosyltransferase involved in cell wall biosynthesis